jgi:hypothetical protein
VARTRSQQPYNDDGGVKERKEERGRRERSTVEGAIPDSASRDALSTNGRGTRSRLPFICPGGTKHAAILSLTREAWCRAIQKGGRALPLLVGEEDGGLPARRQAAAVGSKRHGYATKRITMRSETGYRSVAEVANAQGWTRMYSLQEKASEMARLEKRAEDRRTEEHGEVQERAKDNRRGAD